MTYYNFNPNQSTDNSSDLIYDLRQYYARIVGGHLIEIWEARREKQYPRYFKALDDLHTIISHKITARDKGIKTRYKELNDEAVITFNKWKDVYFGKVKDVVGVSEVESVLKRIEMLLYEVMDDANMFGSNRKIQGL